MLKYALPGWLIGHSPLPQMQAAGLKACSVGAHYECIPVAPGELAATIRQRAENGYYGWNASVPCGKEMHDIRDDAAAPEAPAQTVSMVIVKEDHTCGYLTDIIGESHALKRPFGLKNPPLRKRFRGPCGAALPAAVYYCARHGVCECTIADAETSPRQGASQTQ